MSSIDLNAGPDEDRPKIRRLNRLPIFIFIGLAVVFFGVIIWGLSQRGLMRGGEQPDQTQGQPASDFADEMKRGIGDGMIGEPRPDPVIIQPSTETAVEEDRPAVNPFQPTTRQETVQQTTLEPEADWRERLLREQEEALLRERHRQQLAAIQAQSNARNSPMAIDITNLDGAQQSGQQQGQGQGTTLAGTGGMSDLYAAAMRAGLGGQAGAGDQNNQAGKQAFFNQDVADLGYLPNQVVPQRSLPASTPILPGASPPRFARMSMTAPPATGF
jgi:type IV secretion system protein VirB10